MKPLYDPPIEKRRGRSASFSASTAGASPSVFNRSRRQSLSSVPTTSATSKPILALSDDEAKQGRARPLLDLEDPSLDGPSRQDPDDAAADRATQREGRQSKQQRLEEDPNYHATGDMEQFMAQLYDLTHTIDALENDIDEIVALRNQICSLKPSVDIGQVSLQADLHSLSALTTDSGRKIVSLETWLLQLHEWSKQVGKLVKSGQAGETMAEVGEIKFQLANAKLDFADAMERIREGAWKEQERRERTRQWMARRIRAREPEIEDEDVKGLLKAAELGAADGVAQSHVTSYAGLWALQNPFTELAELTHGMRFLHDDLDREIVDEITGKKQPKRIVYLNGVYSKGPPKSSKRSSSTKSSSGTATPRSSWFASRFGVATTARPSATGPAGDDFDARFRYIRAQQYATEKDLEYGFARQELLNRMAFRKKMVIALLLVLIAALILFVTLATMNVDTKTDVDWTSAALEDPSSTFAWGESASSSPTAVAVQPVPTTVAHEASATASMASPSATPELPESSSVPSSEATEASSASRSAPSVSAATTTPADASASTRNTIVFSSSLSESPIPTDLQQVSQVSVATQPSATVWWQPETTIVAAAVAAPNAMTQVTALPAGVTFTMPDTSA
ncbi:hypothetical protein JCM10212_005091 [Sporobolomyces blumeae]